MSPARRLSLSFAEPLGPVGVLAATLLLAAPVQAQGTGGPDLRWGVSSGATSSVFQGDAATFAGTSMPGTELPAELAGRHTGLWVGASLRVGLTDQFGVRTEMNFVQMGGVVERRLQGPADGPVDETARYALNYLTAPVLGVARLPWQGGGLRPSVFVGPSLAIGLPLTVERAGMAA